MEGGRFKADGFVRKRTCDDDYDDYDDDEQKEE